jgi:ubiquinone biosynthesis protein
MEYVQGVLMSDYLRVARTDRFRLSAWHEANDVNPLRVGKRLLGTYLRQLLEDDLFHSDLHPGNLVLLRHSRLALIDFGSLGTTEREFLREYELFFESLNERSARDGRGCVPSVRP